MENEAKSLTVSMASMSGAVGMVCIHIIAMVLLVSACTGICVYIPYIVYTNISRLLGV